MSALALGDLRWRSRRGPAGGPPLLVPGFIESAYDQRTSTIVSGIVAYLASLTGHARRAYDPDVPVEIAGDRRLGHALATVCMDWYRWTAPSFAEALPLPVTAALAAAAIESPSALRLRLFDLVNQAYDGFVASEMRGEALTRLAASLGLGPDAGADLDVALSLDGEEEALLLAAAPSPGAADVIAHYNRGALAALLRHATRIVVLVQAPSGGMIRHLYAICRHLGVYCDVERAEIGEGFRLTLAGPDAIVGPPAAAGPRLATVALRLLRQLGREDSASADLILHERPYQLVLNQSLLRLPGLGQEPAESITGDDDGISRDDPTESPTFDSEVEAQLARDFALLERQRRAAGWRLVREPAPLLAGRRVLLPDFALVRGPLCIFVEVAGFWTPGYLTKKRQALEQLSPETALILAVAPPAAVALAGLPFPLIPYKNAVAIDKLLAVAEARFGDFASRTSGAEERLRETCAATALTGWIAEGELAELLGCHSSGEVLRVLSATPLPDNWTHIAGAGLCGSVLRDALTALLSEVWAGAEGTQSLSLSEFRARVPSTALPTEDDALASLLERLPACTVVRGSLFDVEVGPPGKSLESAAEPVPPIPSSRRQRGRAAATRPRPSASLF